MRNTLRLSSCIAITALLLFSTSCSMVEEEQFKQNHNSTRDIFQTQRTMGNVAPLNDYLVDIQISNDKVVGRARGGSYLGFWRHGVDNYTATAQVLGRDGMVVDATESEDYPDSSRLSEIKSAAVRAACDYAKCEILAYPMFKVNTHNGFFATTYEVEVVGFPAHVAGMQNVRRDVRNGEINFRAENHGEKRLDGRPDTLVPENNRHLYLGEGGVIRVKMEN